nr:YfgG family protein [Citrobacter portucalensis]
MSIALSWVHYKEPFVSQVTSLRKRHRFNSRMIRIVLLISFLFFFGRFVYSAIGAWHHHQDKKESQQTTQPQQTAPAQTDEH